MADVEELVAFRKQTDLTPSQFRARVKGDVELQRKVERLYKKFLPDYPKLNKSCGNCWEDAYIALKTIKIEKVMQKLDSKYSLVAGAVLRDNDTSKMCNRHNLTDELAEYHLRQDATLIRFFDRYPADWQRRIAEKSEKNENKGGKKSGKQSVKPKTETAENEPKNAE